MRDVWVKIGAVREWLIAKPVSYLTLAFLAWGLNWLDIQQVEFEQRGTIAISRQRLDALQSLAKHKDPSNPYVFLECRPVVAGESEADYSDMCTVKFRVRSRRYIDLSKFEEYLLAETEPRESSSECKSLLREIRQTEWRREALLHQCRCLDLHVQKRLDYAAIDGPSSQQSDDSTYRLAGYQKPVAQEGSEASAEALKSELVAQCKDCEAKIASLEQWLANSRAASIGYLSLTGSQQKYPVVQPVEAPKLAILILLSSSLWGLIAIALNRFPKLQPWIDRLRGKATACTEHRKPATIGRSIHCDLGVPCFGTIEVYLVAENETVKSVEADQSNAAASSSMRQSDWWENRIPKRTSRGRLRIQQAAAVALVGWCALCVLRLASDSAWRELFLASPLAGLTHLITGVP